MVKNQAIGPETLALILATDVPLDDKQVQDLLSELLNDPDGLGYAGKSPSEILLLLASPYTRPNTLPQGAEATRYIQPEAWAVMIAKAQTALGGKVTLQAKYGFPFGFNLGGKLTAIPVDYGDSAVVASLAMLVVDGLISQKDIDDARSIPDPSYNDTTHIPSRQSQVLGPSLCPTLTDLIAAGIK